jgi:hypothetical protein
VGVGAGLEQAPMIMLMAIRIAGFMRLIGSKLEANDKPFAFMQFDA